MDAPKMVVGDVHEERKEGFADGKQVVISWFSVDRSESFCGLLEEECDGFWGHCLAGLFVSKSRWDLVLVVSLAATGAVDDRDDNDDRYCIRCR